MLDLARKLNFGESDRRLEIGAGSAGIRSLLERPDDITLIGGDKSTTKDNSSSPS